MQMKNKIKDKIIQTTKRLIVRIVRHLVNSVTTTRANRAIHLNTTAAIHAWLARVDRPRNPSGIDWQEFSLDLATSPPKDSTTNEHGGRCVGV